MLTIGMRIAVSSSQEEETKTSHVLMQPLDTHTRPNADGGPAISIITVNNEISTPNFECHYIEARTKEK